MECDDVTFAPQYAVIWQQDAYDRIIQAFEIPAGACPFGGGPVQVSMQVKPSSISVTKSTAMQVYLLSEDGFDATQAEAADARLVVDGAGAGAAVMMVGANYYTSTRDFDGDGDVDRLFYFRVSDVVAAGLGVGAASLQVQDHTGVFQYDANPVSFPTILP